MKDTDNEVERERKKKKYGLRKILLALRYIGSYGENGVDDDSVVDQIT